MHGSGSLDRAATAADKKNVLQPGSAYRNSTAGLGLAEKRPSTAGVKRYE